MNNVKSRHESEGSTILYGVPKVAYGPSGCTPYPMCVKACANYLGQDISYDYAMAGSGAAFRLTWDTDCWNPGNVDVIFTFDDPMKVYKTGIEALDRKFSLLWRKTKVTESDHKKFSTMHSGGTKEDFIEYIKSQIDKGYPCIALGIIGPCEACIVTGYRDNGQTLLGWNLFQDNPENITDIEFDDSGYFISKSWWENENTIAVMSLGETSENKLTTKDIIKNAIEVMEGRQHGTYAKGMLAYDAWKKAITDNTQFSENAILPILGERLMCQGDAMDCLADGRNNASIYMKKLADEYPEHKQLCKSAEESFAKVVSCIWKMAEALDGYGRNEKHMRNLAKPEVRKKIAELIDEARAADEKALDSLKEFYKVL